MRMKGVLCSGHFRLENFNSFICTNIGWNCRRESRRVAAPFSRREARAKDDVQHSPMDMMRHHDFIVVILLAITGIISFIVIVIMSSIASTSTSPSAGRPFTRASGAETTVSRMPSYVEVLQQERR